jgi:hypothetical protein
VPERTEIVLHQGQAAPPGSKFQATLVRVLAVQVVSLLLLWALQARYGG